MITLAALWGLINGFSFVYFYMSEMLYMSIIILALTTAWAAFTYQLKSQLFPDE